MTSQGTLNGIAGVHLVAAELSLRGYSVAVTARNTPGVDIYASSPNGSRTCSIQVKTNGQERTPNFWLLGSKPVKAAHDYFFVFVNVKRHPSPNEFYIVHSRDVLRHSSKRRAAWNSFYRESGRAALSSWRRLEGRWRSPYRGRKSPNGVLMDYIWKYLSDAGTPVRATELRERIKSDLGGLAKRLGFRFDHALRAALANLQRDNGAIHCTASGKPSKGGRTGYWRATLRA